jgi:transcriptional regulator GlxA family with amidase domain
MTNFTYILPMTKSTRIIFLIYPSFELLDMSGPAAVFSHANALLSRSVYQVLVASSEGGAIASSCGVRVESIAVDALRFTGTDTVLVMGAEEVALRKAITDASLVKTIQRAAKSAGRYGSVCVGTFLLGAAGLLEGKRAATHWAGNAKLQSVFAAAQVEPDALYVNDGRLWTSAGATSGIDMALAMLEQDHGSSIMAQVAKQLVVYARRPGYQSQFSTTLVTQGAADGVFGELAAWLEERVGEPVTVAEMAAQVSMSERSFHRKFIAATERTPANYFEDICLQRAKLYLEANEAVKIVAAKVGYRSESAFRIAFRKRFGVTPRHHVLMHASVNSDE